MISTDSVAAPTERSANRSTPERIAEKRYNISETFCSPQGEGHFVGVSHYFIRFAGCTVGKRFTADTLVAIGAEAVSQLHNYQECCTAWNGTHFACDTNYRMAEKLTVSQIMALIPDNVKHVCLTGGEPLMHDLEPLMRALCNAGKLVHIETSGTIDFTRFDWYYGEYGWFNGLRQSFPHVWIAVSPKANYLDVCIREASELKVLIGNDFDETTFMRAFGELIPEGNVFIQPINGEFTVDPVNATKCLDLQQKYPDLKISVQAHKILQCR